MSRLNEQFGYEYDAAWNLNRRTNNALVQTFSTDNRNQLTSAGRSGTLTVAGVASQPGANLDHVTVSGTGLSSGNANVYADGSWARTGATMADGNNTYTAEAEDTQGRTASDAINLSLPSTINFQYDSNGNLTNDGRRVFEYDFENQLTNVFVAAAWRSEFRYDAFGRRRVRKEYGWNGSAWTLTNEVRYVYDQMLVVQERNANNLALVSYTRGRDLRGTLQKAGGIGNITALANTNGLLVGKYYYDPYGNLLGLNGHAAEANLYRFSSKEWHANSGLVYYLYRYYEPNLQRWPNRDPLGDRAFKKRFNVASSRKRIDRNLYHFIFNSSVYGVDPFGLDGQPWPLNGSVCNCEDNPLPVCVLIDGDYFTLPPGQCTEYEVDVDGYWVGTTFYAHEQVIGRGNACKPKEKCKWNGESEDPKAPDQPHPNSPSGRGSQGKYCYGHDCSDGYGNNYPDGCGPIYTPPPNPPFWPDF